MSIPVSFLFLDTLALMGMVYCVWLLYTVPKRWQWSGTTKLLLALCTGDVLYSVLKGFLPSKSHVECGPAGGSVCMFADNMPLSGRQMFILFQAILLCYRQVCIPSRMRAQCCVLFRS